MIGDNTRNDYEPEIQEIDQQRTKKKDQKWQSDVLERMELLENDKTGDYIQV